MNAHWHSEKKLLLFILKSINCVHSIRWWTQCAQMPRTYSIGSGLFSPRGNFYRLCRPLCTHPDTMADDHVDLCADCSAWWKRLPHAYADYGQFSTDILALLFDRWRSSRAELNHRRRLATPIGHRYRCKCRHLCPPARQDAASSLQCAPNCLHWLTEIVGTHWHRNTLRIGRWKI